MASTKKPGPVTVTYRHVGPYPAVYTELHAADGSTLELAPGETVTYPADDKRPGQYPHLQPVPSPAEPAPSSDQEA